MKLRTSTLAAILVAASLSATTVQARPLGFHGGFGHYGCQSASGFHPRMANNPKKPTIYDRATNQPCRSHRPTDLASGYMLEIATPADEPNQIIEPPKPTAYARMAQS